MSITKPIITQFHGRWLEALLCRTPFQFHDPNTLSLLRLSVESVVVNSRSQISGEREEYAAHFTDLQGVLNAFDRISEACQRPISRSSFPRAFT
jgi:hypothetical protein